MRRINGIGPKAGAKLASLGITTIGDLAAQPRAVARTLRQELRRLAARRRHGRDERPVVTHSEPVSISRETTFERDLHARRDRAELAAIFTRLCEQVAADLQRKGYVGRTVGIKLRFDDFRTVTRDLTLEEATADAQPIRGAAGACLKRVDLKLPSAPAGRARRLAGQGRADACGAPQTLHHSAPAPGRRAALRAQRRVGDILTLATTAAPAAPS